MAARASKKKEVPKGYTCEHCGAFNEFPLYVFSHWMDLINHICDCGAKSEIRMGKALLLKKGRKAVKHVR